MGECIIRSGREIISQNDFLNLPFSIYRNDSNYSIIAKETVKSGLERDSFIGRQELFVAYQDGTPVARIAARISPDLKDENRSPLGLLSYFECINDPNVAQNIFEAARNWFTTRKISGIIGPMDGDTWHRYRLNAGPFDTPPFMLEPYNPSYYCELWEKSGFSLLSSYYSKRVSDIGEVLPLMEKYHKRALKEGFSFRTFRLDDFDSELCLLHKLSLEIFSKNYLYSPITEEDFKNLYKSSKSILNPELICFAMDKNGKPVGYVFAIPDYFVALRAMNGKHNLFAKIRFLLNRKKAEALNIKTLGIIPTCRGGGLSAALMYLSYKKGFELGFRKANLCLIREDNPSGRLDAGKGTVSRTYKLYQYTGAKNA